MDGELQMYLMNLCNCTNIIIRGISFECINDSVASYSFLVAGEGALEVAVAFNHSLNNRERLTTNDGVSFSLHMHSPIQNNSTTSTSTDDDTDTIHLNLFTFLVIAVILVVGLILIVGGLSVGM